MKVNFGRKITLRKDKCDNNKINQEETMIMIVSTILRFSRDRDLEHGKGDPI
jgi:hypothetical protein